MNHATTPLSAPRPRCATVAVVNNTDPTRQSLGEALGERGISVLAYADGQSLLNDPRLRAFDLIVADWTNSPNGADLWDALMQKTYSGRVVFMSPHAPAIADAVAGARCAPAAIIDMPISVTKATACIVNQLTR